MSKRLRAVASTALDVALILCIAGGVAMYSIPAGFIALGVIGLGVTFWRNR